MLFREFGWMMCWMKMALLVAIEMVSMRSGSQQSPCMRIVYSSDQLVGFSIFRRKCACNEYYQRYEQEGQSHSSTDPADIKNEPKIHIVGISQGDECV
jgi:hypothetical protein